MLIKRTLRILFLVALSFSYTSVLSQSSIAQSSNDGQNESPILDYARIQDYSSDELYEYNRALILLMSELEHFQQLDGNFKKKNAFLLKLIESSYAGTETDPPYTLGNNCLIGGFFGNFESKSGTGTKDITCDSPNRCTTASGGRGHVCNPLYFTYEKPATGKAFCAPLTRDLTTTGCLPMFDALYKRMCGNSNDFCDAFAEHFKATVKKATGKDSPAAMRKYVDSVLAEYKRIEKYCFDSNGNTKEHIIGQKESCFKLRAYYKRLLEVYNKTRSADFSCIDAGLKKAVPGYQAPSSQVEFLKLRSKEIADSRKLTGMRARETNARRSVIFSLSAVGVCTDKPMSSRSANEVNKLLAERKLQTLPAATYVSTFDGAHPSVIKNNGLLSNNFKQRAKNWEANAGGLRSCNKQSLSASQQVELCVKLHKACGMDSSKCKDTERDSDDSSGGGSNGGPGPAPEDEDEEVGERGEGGANADRGGPQGAGPGG